MDENIEACINFTEPRMYEKYAELITQYDKDMKQYLDKATDINEQEGLFGLNSTN